MRIVLFSDSHNRFEVLQHIVEAQPEAQLFYHLGDGYREMEDLRALFPDKRIEGVCGNCDWLARGKGEDVVEIGGKRLFLTHGHMYEVKFSLRKLAETARKLQADVAAFGHTHTAFYKYEDGLHLFNPGSVTHPRGGPPTYGVLDVLDDGSISLFHVELEKRRGAQ